MVSFKLFDKNKNDANSGQRSNEGRGTSSEPRGSAGGLSDIQEDAAMDFDVIEPTVTPTNKDSDEKRDDRVVGRYVEEDDEEGRVVDQHGAMEKHSPPAPKNIRRFIAFDFDQTMAAIHVYHHCSRGLDHKPATFADQVEN